MSRRGFLAVAALLCPCRVSAGYPHVGLYPAYRAYLISQGVRPGELLMIERYGERPGRRRRR